MAVPITAREPVEFYPTALKEHPTKKKIVIIVRVPTLVERDSYASAMVRAGVVYYTQKQIRDFTLAGVQAIYPKELQDDHLALLEELWLVNDEERRVEHEQHKALVDLHVAAKAMGKTPKQQQVLTELNKIKPTIKMDKQRRVKAAALAGEIASKFEILREALASLAEQDSRRHYMNAKTYVISWKGLKHDPDGNGQGGIQQHEADYLRESIGEEAWEELSDFITSMQYVDGEEEKNSDSPIANTSDAIGSTASETSKASNGRGGSTGGPSTRTRGNGSRKTTASSSGSSKSSRTKKAT